LQGCGFEVPPLFNNTSNLKGFIMNVTVFGAGYVGLVQGAVLAEVGHKVTCVDVDGAKISNLNKGIIPIYEPGLSDIIIKCLENGTLAFTTDSKLAVESASIIFIAVGTPPDEDGSADLKYVINVAKTIGQHADGSKIIVTKSTVPVGTSDKVRDALYCAAKTNPNPLPLEAFSVVSNPEFLKEGSAVNDCKRPDRIIIGTDDKRSIDAMKQLYAAFNRNHDRIITMDTRSAELTKYAANCMLATKISFMNEMANISEAVGADIEAVRRGIGSDPRIGYQFIYPGCGYGGSCFPKDVQALVRIAEEANVPPLILSAVEKTNYKQKHKLASYINQHYHIEANSDLSGKTFAVWGLAFKPNTDDMREAPSLYLINELLKRGATVKAFDPKSMMETRRIMGKGSLLQLQDSAAECLEGADALVVCTEWEIFREPDLALLSKKLNDRVIFDGRNMYSGQALRKHQLDYYGIGRGLSITTTL
jgi:UDPglucose 6-dehydrogenase